VLPDVINGMQAGNFGWLSWAGDVGVPSLERSLTPPGDSRAYTNPDDPSDRSLSVGDWVRGRPGVANSARIRAALDRLKSLDITVPVWDRATGSGRNASYHVVGFARVRLLDYRLPKENRLTARFLGLPTCATGANSPSQLDAAGQLPTDGRLATLLDASGPGAAAQPENREPPAMRWLARLGDLVRGLLQGRPGLD
jgi:hypothetical protein